VDHTVLPANTPQLPSPRNVSPEGASAVCSKSSHLIAAYYPERMKDWVGLAGWPTADTCKALRFTKQIPRCYRLPSDCRQLKAKVLPEPQGPIRRRWSRFL